MQKEPLERVVLLLLTQQNKRLNDVGYNCKKYIATQYQNTYAKRATRKSGSFFCFFYVSLYIYTCAHAYMHARMRDILKYFNHCAQPKNKNPSLPRGG